MMECDDCTALYPYAEMRVLQDGPGDPNAQWLCLECLEARVQDFGPLDTSAVG